MSAATVPLGNDFKVMSLIGVAHGASHYYQLAFATMLLIVRQEAGLTFTDVGLLAGIFYGVSGIAQTFAGFAVDRFGARPILAGGLAVIGVALALVSFAHSFPAFAAIAVVAGLGNCVFHPADFALLNASVNQGRLGRAYSIHGVGGSLGWAAAPIMYFLDSMFGWVGAALIGATPGLVLAVLVWSQRETLIDHRVKARAVAAQHGATPAFSLFLQPAILLCLVYFALIAANTVGIQQFAVPAWTSMFGIGENYAALCLIVFIVGPGASPRPGGDGGHVDRCRAYRADRHRERAAGAAAPAARPGRCRRRAHRPVARHDRAQRHPAWRVRQGLRLCLLRPRCRLVPGAAAVRVPDVLWPAERHLLDRYRSLHRQCRAGAVDPPEHGALRDDEGAGGGGIATYTYLARAGYSSVEAAKNDLTLSRYDFFDSRANFSVVLSAAKDLIAAWYECTLELLAMRSFAVLRMTEEGRQSSIKSHPPRSGHRPRLGG